MLYSLPHPEKSSPFPLIAHIVMSILDGGISTTRNRRSNPMMSAEQATLRKSSVHFWFYSPFLLAFKIVPNPFNPESWILNHVTINICDNSGKVNLKEISTFLHSPLSPCWQSIIRKDAILNIRFGQEIHWKVNLIISYHTFVYNWSGFIVIKA